MGSLLKLLKPLRFLRRRAIYSGVFGGNRTWLAVGGAAWVARWIRSLFAGGEPSTVFLEELKPGQRLVITHPDAAKKTAKQAKKSAKQADNTAKKAGKAAKKNARRERG